MNFKYITAIAFIIASAYSAKAQIKVNKPAGLDGVIAARTAYKKNPNTKVRGYQILIYNGSNRSVAESMKAKFDAEFKIHSEVVWDEPNFKVYVGQFLSKFECMKFYEEIKGKFQTTIVVPNKISYPSVN